MKTLEVVVPVIYKVKSHEEGIRLDALLFERLRLEMPGVYSRGSLMEMIRCGQVLYNGIPALKPAQRVRMNDIVSFEFRENEEYKQKEESSSIHEAYLEPTVIFEDKEVLFVNKPAGLMTHPARAGDNSLIDWLSVHYPHIMQVGDDPLRPGIVHRLDKDTSGILVIAKRDASFKALKELFQQRLVEKTYFAIIEGHVVQMSGTITFPITRIPHSEKRSVRHATNNPEAKEAMTIYRVLKRFEECDFVEVQPKTGRTHQIRIHFSALQHPIVGDRLYGFRRKATIQGVKRQMLHAGRLRFTLFNREYDREALLPLDFSTLLQDLTAKQ